jgi:hypothetical protein
VKTGLEFFGIQLAKKSQNFLGDQSAFRSQKWILRSRFDLQSRLNFRQGHIALPNWYASCLLSREVGNDVESTDNNGTAICSKLAGGGRGPSVDFDLVAVPFFLE